MQLHRRKLLLILPRIPVDARQARGANTRRAARRKRDVSGRHRDVPSGLPLVLANRPRAAWTAGRPRGLLWLLDQPASVEKRCLATQESDPRNARNVFDLGETAGLESQPHTGFRIPEKRTPAKAGVLYVSMKTVFSYCAGLAFWLAIHWSTRRSSKVSGKAPPPSTLSWKPLMSNLSPSSASAFLRNSWIRIMPIL